jgi:L-tyrosine C(3)-methyltransferase
LALNREKFELIAGGHTAFQLFWAGIDLGLFNLLSRRPGLTEARAARALGLAAQPARILLVGLLSLGLVERRGSRFRNAPAVEQNLVDGKPGSLADVFRWQAHIVYPALADLTDSLRRYANVGVRRFPGRGRTLYQRLASHPRLERVFQNAMSALSSRTNAALWARYDFGRFRRVLDVGGGDGTNAAGLVRAFPSLRATVFDMPSVCRLARAKLRRLGLRERVDVRPGNFLKDRFPPGADAILFNHICPIWSKERNLDLFRRSFRALPKGGAVFVYNMMSNDDDRGPLTPAFGSLYFLAVATGEGMLYRWKDYAAWLRRAGFRKVERIRGLPLHHGLLIGVK